MTWDAVARKDFRDAIRSRWLWALSLFYVIFLGGSTVVFYGWLVGGSDATSDALFGLFATGLLSFSFTGFLGFLLAFTALVTSYGSIIDERESGTMKLLLALPHDRLDVVVGKFIGRSGVVALPAVAGFVVALVALVATGTEVSWGAMAVQVVLSVALVVIFVAIGVGISASAETGRGAILGTLGLYVLFALFWSPLSTSIRTIASEIITRVPSLGVDQSLAFEFGMAVKYLNPLRAYETLVAQAYFGDALQARLVKAGFQEQIVAGQLYTDGLPFYLQDWWLVVVLVAWLVLPLVLGYRVFASLDL